MAPSEPPMACNMEALTRDERSAHAQLAKTLVAATTERREMPNGYAFDLAPGQMSLAEVGQWIAFESRCCPFLDFRLDVGREGMHVSLQLTGGEGVKEFLKAEIPQMG